MRVIGLFAVAACWLASHAAELDETSSCYGIVEEVKASATPTELATAEGTVNAYLTALPGWLAFDCKQSLRNFLCLANYASIIETPDEEPATLCSDVCDRVNDKCADFLQQASDSLGPLIAGLQTCQDAMDCVEGNYNVAFAADEPSCPKPLVVPDRDDPTYPIAGTGCALPCLSYMYTDDEWRTSMDSLEFFSYFGFAAGVYMIFVSAYKFYIASEDHKTGAFFVWTFSIGCTLSGLGAVTLVASGMEEHLCFGNATASGTDDGVCLAQGYLYLVGAMVVIASSLCMCTDLYLRVVRNERKATLRWFRRVYAVIFFVLLVTSSTIAAATNSMGYDPSLSVPSCFVMSRDEDWIIYATYYGPSIVGNGLALCMMAIAIVKINQVFHRNTVFADGAERASTMGQVRGMQKFVRYNIRPLLFIVLVGFVGLYSSGVKFYYEDKQDQIAHSSKKFIRCLLQVGATDPDGAAKACGEVPDTRPDHDVMLVAILQICAIGALPLLIYGLKYPECSVFKGWSSTSNVSPPRTSAKQYSTSNGYRSTQGSGYRTATPSAALASTAVAEPPTIVEMVDVEHDDDDKDSDVLPVVVKEVGVV